MVQGCGSRSHAWSTGMEHKHGSQAWRSQAWSTGMEHRYKAKAWGKGMGRGIVWCMGYQKCDELGMVWRPILRVVWCRNLGAIAAAVVMGPRVCMPVCMPVCDGPTCDAIRNHSTSTSTSPVPCRSGISPHSLVTSLHPPGLLALLAPCSVPRGGRLLSAPGLFRALRAPLRPAVPRWGRSCGRSGRTARRGHG